MKIKVYVVDFEVPRRTKRMVLLVGIPLAALLGGAAMLYAAPKNVFVPGDTLSATKMNENFKDLDERLHLVEASSGQVEGDVATLNTDVTSLEADVAALKAGADALDARLDAHLGVGVSTLQSAPANIANGDWGEVCTAACPGSSFTTGGGCLSTGCGPGFNYPCPGFNVLASQRGGGEVWCCDFQNASGSTHAAFAKQQCLATNVPSPL